MKRHAFFLLVSLLLAWLGPRLATPAPEQKPPEANPSAPATIETIYKVSINTAGLGQEHANAVSGAIQLIKKEKLDEAGALLDKALADFEKLLTNPKLSYLCFRAAKDHQDFVEALRKKEGEPAADAVVRVTWCFAEALQMKAFIAAARKQWKVALESLDREIRYSPCAASPHVERGYVLNHLGRPAEALLSYEKAVHLADQFESSNPELPLALRGMGFALIELGRLDDAKEAYNKSLELDPGNKLAIHELEYIQELQKKNPPKKPEPKP